MKTCFFTSRIDRRRHPHRPTQTSASTDADIRTDRCGCYYCLLLLSVVQIYVL
ncbi:hypothetical protein [Leyella stercorea]|uniref:hypothetical protein n=1 Tax=Leyella stercorea TaxID=363265 RepID=UPI00266D9B4B|nr:hypothetical protein [Leyella stercorea]